MTTIALVRDQSFGRKHTCADCGTRFYDLNKPAVVCPRCGRQDTAAAASREAPREVVEEVAAAQVVDVDESEDVALDEVGLGLDDLGDDDLGDDDLGDDDLGDDDLGDDDLGDDSDP